MNKENIIDYDFQGWPVYKITVRDILKSFCKHEDGKYFIEDNNPILDIFPITLEDDGMGYGVNDKYITTFDIVNNDRINIFIEKQLPNIELWRDSKISPWQTFKMNGKEWWTIDIRNGENGFEYYVEDISEETLEKNDKDAERMWVKESDIHDE